MSTKPVVQRALISTSDKTGLVDFALALHSLGIEIIATGGTSKLLQSNNIPVIDVADITGFPEIMDGRVKTLHPKIHGGLLARRGTDDAILEQHQIQPIDLLVVNLYPFQETIAKSDCSLASAIENIDIGGPTMLRAAAKNYHDVTVVVDPADYLAVLDEIKTCGNTSKTTRQQLALKTFTHTAQYDAAISHYLSQRFKSTTEPLDTDFPDTMELTFDKSLDLRYGENPHQGAAAYTDPHAPAGCLANATLIQGKPLSFNNLMDSEGALNCLRELDSQIPGCVIVKHATPCGAAYGDNLTEAYQKALSTDPTSAFGGIIAVNQTLDAQTAQTMIDAQFIEVLLVPAISEEAKTIVAKKKNCRVLVCGQAPIHSAQTLHSISGGVLIQQADALITDPNTFKIVTQKKPTKHEMEDLLFAWYVVKFVKSNAIVYAKDGMTLGLGTGQTSRVFSARIAALKAEEAGLSLIGAAMASDAFFPFADGVEVAAQAGITSVIQPGGSKRDDEVIAAADKLGLVMVMTGSRHFRH